MRSYTTAVASPYLLGLFINVLRHQASIVMNILLVKLKTMPSFFNITTLP